MSLDHIVLMRPHPGHVRLRDTPDGGALFTTRNLQPGDIVMLDNAVALYPSSPRCLRIFCSHCFRVLPSQPLPCPHCNQARFCSERCLMHSHPHLICHALPTLVSGKAPWNHNILFLLAAYSLRFSKIFRLLPLDLKAVVPDASMERLHSELASLCKYCTGKKMPSHFKPEFTYGLLSMKRKTSVALKPPRDPKYGSLRVDGDRGYGLYLWSSMLKHSCTPNVCRFDHVDVPGIPNNTSFQYRAAHAINDGVEITTSYVDVAWGYRERQDRLLADYGLKCDCLRCKTESRWMENKEKLEAEDNNGEGIDHIPEEMNEEEEEEEQEMNEELGEVVDAMRGDEELEMSEEEGSDDNSCFFVNEYIRRHICHCGGFLAPTPPMLLVPGFIKMECNGCREFSDYEHGDPWDDHAM